MVFGRLTKNLESTEDRNLCGMTGKQVSKAKEKDTVLKVCTQCFAEDATKPAIETCKVALKVDILERRRGSYPASSFFVGHF